MKKLFLLFCFVIFAGTSGYTFAYDTCNINNPVVPCSYGQYDYDTFIQTQNGPNGGWGTAMFYNSTFLISDPSNFFKQEPENFYISFTNYGNLIQHGLLFYYGSLYNGNGAFNGASFEYGSNFIWIGVDGPVPDKVLHITRSPELGGGVIVTVPPGFPEFQCGTEGQEECDFDVDYNAQVTLEAQPNAGYAFSHWEINNATMGDTDGTITIPMSEDKDVVAVFKLDYLSFPLSGSTPFTALVSSVFDHSGNADYGDSDHQVTAFNGEANNAQTPYTGTTCYSKSDSSAFGSGFTYQGYGQAGVYYLCYNGHPGYDYAVGVGTNVYSAAPGKVTVAEDDPCLGYNVTIEHDAEYVTRYFHLDSIDTSNVQVDQDIPSGVRIGTSGDTGTCSDGAHLHFQVEKNGIPVDPYGWTGGGTDPYTRTTNVTLWE